jgi:hypothetical protein
VIFEAAAAGSFGECLDSREKGSCFNEERGRAIMRSNSGKKREVLSSSKNDDDDRPR